MNSISTKELDISYDDVLIVSNMEMDIKQGKITSIIGPNGCGKSTVLKAIGRILKPKKGLVLLSGEDIKKLSTKEIATKMAILPQTPTAPSGLTVSELIAYGRFPHQKGFGKLTPKDKEIIQWALNVTKLADYEDREVDTLSGGQRQRVWIAMRAGKIIKQGSPKEIMNIEVLKEAFHVEAQIVEDKKSNRPICLTYDLIKA